MFANNLDKSKKVRIAASLVKQGIEICKSENEELNQDIPDSVGIISSYLENTVKICNDISYRSISNTVEKSASEKNLTYLFRWNRL